MKITINSTNSVQKEDISETDLSISKGINIYDLPPPSSDSKRPSVKKMPYGIYFGGNISTGGGEPVGVSTWVANWDDVEQSAQQSSVDVEAVRITAKEKTEK